MTARITPSIIWTKLYPSGKPLPGPHCKDCLHWEKPPNGANAQCRAADMELCADVRRSTICGANPPKLFKWAPLVERERRKEQWGDDPS